MAPRLSVSHCVSARATKGYEQFDEGVVASSTHHLTNPAKKANGNDDGCESDGEYGRYSTCSEMASTGREEEGVGLGGRGLTLPSMRARASSKSSHLCSSLDSDVNYAKKNQNIVTH